MNTCEPLTIQRCSRLMRHVVVDTNCLLRMIPVRSKYRPVWEAFLNEEYVICVSNEILSEYLEILTQQVSYTFAVRINNVLLKSNSIKFFDPHFHFGLIVQDPDDNKFVDCAIAANGMNSTAIANKNFLIIIFIKVILRTQPNRLAPLSSYS